MIAEALGHVIGRDGNSEKRPEMDEQAGRGEQHPVRMVFQSNPYKSEAKSVEKQGWKPQCV